MKTIAVVVIAIFILIGCRTNNVDSLRDTDWSIVKVKTKSSDVNDRVEIGSTGYVMYYDMNKVLFIRDNNNEISFQANNKDYYGIISYERAKIPMNKITDLLYRGINYQFKDAKLEEDNVVIVNGIIVKSCLISFNVEGMHTKMICYLLSGDSGTIQVRVAAVDNVFDSVRPDMELFINGLAKNDF